MYLKYHKNKCKRGGIWVIPPVSFCAVLYVESRTPIMCFWIFFPQEHAVTCRPEKLHLYPPIFFQGLKRKSLRRCWKGRCWETYLPWLMWDGIPWVGALGCWACWWDRSFPDCSPKLLVPDKANPMNMVCIDPSSLLRLKKPTLLSWVPESCSLDRCSSASFGCFLSTPKSNPFILPSVSVAVWGTSLGNKAVILKSTLGL